MKSGVKSWETVIQEDGINSVAMLMDRAAFFFFFFFDHRGEDPDKISGVGTTLLRDMTFDAIGFQFTLTSSDSN